MSLDLIVRPVAEDEIAEAFDWYEARVRGLGAQFLLSLGTTMQSIVHQPEMYPVVHSAAPPQNQRPAQYSKIFAGSEDFRGQ